MSPNLTKPSRQVSQALLVVLQLRQFVMPQLGRQTEVVTLDTWRVKFTAQPAQTVVPAVVVQV